MNGFNDQVELLLLRQFQRSSALAVLDIKFCSLQNEVLDDRGVGLSVDEAGNVKGRVSAGALGRVDFGSGGDQHLTDVQAARVGSVTKRKRSPSAPMIDFNVWIGFVLQEEFECRNGIRQGTDLVSS
jgi:hypothetical protein